MLDSRFSRIGRIIVFPLAVILLIYTVASTTVFSIPPTELGLVSELPLTYWIGLVLLGCLWYLCLKGPLKYQILTLTLTISYIFVAPAIIKTPVWISESFYPFGESLLINSQGHVVIRDYAPLLSYQDWPIFLYLASSLKLVTGLPDSLIQRFFPLLTISMYGLLTFLILRSKLNSFAAFGAALFLSSFFLRQQYFGPQGIAYIFFLLIVLLMSQLFFEHRAKKTTLAALYLLLFTIITMTHALTSFMVMVVIVAVYIGHKFMNRKPPSITARLILFSVLFVLTYNIFIAPGFFDLSVERTSEFISEIISGGIGRELSRFPGSPAQRMSYYASWGIVLLTGLTAAFQVIYVLYRARSRKRTDNETFSIFMVVWLTLAVLVGLTTVYGSNEAYQRAFMFGLIPLTYLCTSLLSRRPKVLVLFVCCLLFLNIPAQYGSDTYRLATDGVLAGTKFFVIHTPQNTTCLYSFYPHVRYFDPLKYVQFVNIHGTLPFTRVPNGTDVQKAVSSADYIIRSDLQHNYYLYFLREDPFESVNAAPVLDRLNRVYDDQSFCLFRHVEADSLP
jgi:hypothetical protein